MPAQTYDVFLSFSGVDREAGRRLAEELRGLSLTVFLDEDSIEPGTGITRSIRDGLGASKLLVAYYSADYAVRHACQFELRTVFLAGAREGDSCARIMVINPEPGTDHLRPLDLADAKYVRPSADDPDLAQLVVKRAAAVERPIGEVRPAMPPRWSADRARSTRNFVGRYREQWDLHSALHAIVFDLVDERAYGQFAAVCGLPGAGKTALVDAYAWRFAAAFPGGVDRVSLAGVPAEPDALRQKYAAELRRVAENRYLQVDADSTDQEVAAAVRDSLTSGGTSLWVVDDIPSDLGSAVLDLLPLPADTAVRTVLISEDDLFEGAYPVVRVGPLPEPDAVVLLDDYRLPDDDADRAARDTLIHELGRNAGALAAVGDHLRDRQGLSSYRTFHADLKAADHLETAVFARLQPVLARMTPPELALLRSARTGTKPLPAAALATLHDLDPLELGTTLKQLLHRSAAIRTDSEWHLDPYVVRAARDQPRPRVPTPEQ